MNAVSRMETTNPRIDLSSIKRTAMATIAVHILNCAACVKSSFVAAYDRPSRPAKYLTSILACQSRFFRCRVVICESRIGKTNAVTDAKAAYRKGFVPCTSLIENLLVDGIRSNKLMKRKLDIATAAIFNEAFGLGTGSTGRGLIWTFGSGVGGSVS